MVYHQLTNPNPEACTLAEIESYRGRRAKGPIKVDITADHLADGLGMPRELFHQVRTGLKEKVAYHLTLKPHEQDHHSAVLALERIFEVHVPRTASAIVVRRIFTIKARADYKKIINGWQDPVAGVKLTFDQVSDLLKTVGARPPVMDANQATLTCFGILWECNNNVCRNCDLYVPCNAEAASLGLASILTSTTDSVLDKGGFNLSPKLLPATAKVRTAHKTDDSVRATPAVKASEKPPTSVAEEEIVSYLKKNFWSFKCFKDTYYTHRGDTSMRRGTSYLFWVGHLLNGKRHPDGQLRVAFIPPVKEKGAPDPVWWVEIKSKLEKVGGSYYLPLNSEYHTFVELAEKQADSRPSNIVPRKRVAKPCPKPQSLISPIVT